ncbi:MAG TPA: hypothetical protein VFM69_09170 [Pricia sp.]|nr:hypothetical protein [Pricia sp.]
MNRKTIRFSIYGAIITILSAIFVSVVFGGFIDVGVTAGHPKPIEWAFLERMEGQ